VPTIRLQILVAGNGELFVRRNKRRIPEDELPVSNDEIEASAEEIELSDFLENLGPEGVTEVCLYRVLPTGKRVFVTSGPPSQFSELSVQQNHGAGDYIARKAAGAMASIAFILG